MSKPVSKPASRPSPLEFEPPEEGGGQKWVGAEKAAFKFPERYLQQARELHQCRQDLKSTEADRDRLTGLVLRNLIAVLDNCREALDQTAPAESESLVLSTLASTRRMILYLLEQFGAVPIELLGHTYEDVVVDGQKVLDPFEVESVTQSGKSTEVKVLGVICDLWVRRRGGAVEVLRRGRVTC